MADWLVVPLQVAGAFLGVATSLTINGMMGFHPLQKPIRHGVLGFAGILMVNGLSSVYASSPGHYKGLFDYYRSKEALFNQLADERRAEYQAIKTAQLQDEEAYHASHPPSVHAH
eukprot:TRINITY_DN1103_c0_g1_i1.p1 TRINITY_DN1103_c0_g1~~TRINITY_DN1103_c0_g1_i1.p1  ORF type:complete len:130 (-),score=17.61 TRINITY_DN1103_c0_g1_i1:27-371(-)